MNYFGMFFCFMIPGVLVGLLLASGLSAAAAKRSRRSHRA